jgi:prepilin-type N-terminal cleavage/methylation domain-containing protein
MPPIKKTKQGLTLLELMVAVFIVVIAIIPAYQLFIGGLNLDNQSREICLAAMAASSVMEKIRGINFATLTTTLNGTINLTYAGGPLLRNETVMVSYPNGTAGDPLNITIIVNWTSRSRRMISNDFHTSRTRAIW